MMEWVEIDSGWELTVFYGCISVFTIEKDKDGDWELKSKWQEEFLGCLTDGEAKAEAIEIMVSSLEGEKNYLDELISGMKEMEVQDESDLRQ